MVLFQARSVVEFCFSSMNNTAIRAYNNDILVF